MHSPEQPAPDILAGRRVRKTDLELDGVHVFVLEAADADAVLEETVADAGDPYAAILWPSALAAATRLAREAAPGDRVLDLGAGTGLAALVAARLGCVAQALDHDPFARAVVAEAARLQGLHVDVLDFDLHSGRPLPAADLVVMADLLYEPELARMAARRVHEAVRGGARVIVGDPARFGRAEFERVMSAIGLPVTFEDVVIRIPGDPQPARVGIAVIG